MALVILPRQLVVDINGEPRVGALALVYDAGTNNTRTAYTTKALTIVLEQPIRAQEGGLFPAFYVDSAAGDYKLVIQDGDGSLVYSEDNLSAYGDIDLSALATNSQTAPIIFSLRRTAAEIVAGVMPVNYAYPPGDLRRYGCTTDGTGDNTAAINDAIAAARAAGGTGWIYHPGGIIRHTGLILFGPGLTVFGQDRKKCIFEYVGTTTAWRHTNNGTTSPVVNISGFGNVSFFGVQITTNSGGNTGAALELSAMGHSYYELGECWISGSFKYGLILDGVEICHVHHSIIENSGPVNAINIWIVNGPDRVVGQGAGWTNGLAIHHNQISGNGNYGLIDDGGANHNINFNNFNGHGVPITLCKVVGFSLTGNNMENAGVVTGNANVLFTDTTAVGGASLGPCLSGSVKHNVFGADMNSGSSLVFGGASFHQGITVENNYFRFNLGLGVAIDLTKLANSFCGHNYDAITGAHDHYGGSHNDANGNTLLPPQNGFAGTFANAAAVYGDTRYPHDFRGGLRVGSTATISKLLSGTRTSTDFASIADGAMTSTTMTVTGAALGDNVLSVSHTVAVPAGATLTGQVTATDTVTVTLFNKTGGALDLATGTLIAIVARCV